MKILIILLFNFSLFAKSKIIAWEPIPEVKYYEYEIYSGPEVTSRNLFKQGRSKSSQINLNLDPAIYYFRVRAFDKSGRAGLWSALLKQVVEGDVPVFKIPKPHEQIDIEGLGSPIYFEWSRIEGADDYLIIFTKLNSSQSLSRSSFVNSLALDALSTGAWQVQVLPRQKGEPISKSDPLEFSVNIKELSKPIFKTPMDGEIKSTADSIEVSWDRRVPGTQSEVLVRKSNKGILHRIVVENSTSARLPLLPPGRYQIIVKDFLEDNKRYVMNAVIITTDDRVYGLRNYSADFIFLPGLGIGHYSQSNVYYPQSMNSGSQFLSLKAQGVVSLSGRWAAEAHGYLENIRYDSPSIKGSGSTDSMRILLGLNYAFNWFTSQPWEYKTLISIKKYPRVVKESTSSTEGFVSNSYSFGLGTGLKTAFGKSPTFDFPSELLLTFPFSGTGDDIGGGNPVFYIPEIQASLYARYKLKVWKFLIGFEYRFDNLSIKEDSTSVKTKSKYSGIIPRLGLELQFK